MPADSGNTRPTVVEPAVADPISAPPPVYDNAEQPDYTKTPTTTQLFAASSVVDPKQAALSARDDKLNTPVMATYRLATPLRTDFQAAASVMADLEFADLVASDAARPDGCFCNGSKHLRTTCLVMMKLLTYMRGKPGEEVYKKVAEELHLDPSFVQ